ncbi:MAG TPA: hypothetical protein VJ343_01955 [archaeon]|nr:hypothetical protein [archaeon]
MADLLVSGFLDKLFNLIKVLLIMNFRKFLHYFGVHTPNERNSCIFCNMPVWDNYRSQQQRYRGISSSYTRHKIPLKWIFLGLILFFAIIYLHNNPQVVDKIMNSFSNSRPLSTNIFCKENWVLGYLQSPLNPPLNDDNCKAGCYVGAKVTHYKIEGAACWCDVNNCNH